MKETDWVIGDSLVCVQNDGKEGKLTVGKRYTLLSLRGINPIVENDLGFRDGFFSYRFRKCATRVIFKSGLLSFTKGQSHD